MNDAILLVACPDQTGLIHKLASYLALHNGNILDLEEHVDTSSNFFYARIRWNLDGFTIPKDNIRNSFKPLMKDIKAQWTIHFTADRSRLALYCSKTDHCVHEILWRVHTKDINADIAFVISNHTDLRVLVEGYGIPFIHTPINERNKAEVEQRQLKLIKDENVDFVVLARYMQILSSSFVDAFENRIINIHHSFLPAFAGGNPYKQAFERGVKIIGATSHYVTSELDQGPIIAQDVTNISHRDQVEDLKTKGKDLERLVLAKAIKLHVNHKIISRENKTVVFD